MQKYLHLYGLDIFGAFVTATIDDPVCVQLPPGLVPPDEDGNPSIWRLKRTRNDLNRAPKAFYDQLTHHLVSHAYTRSAHDPCLFYRLYPDGRKIYFCIHVNDFPRSKTKSPLEPTPRSLAEALLARQETFALAGPNNPM